MTIQLASVLNRSGVLSPEKINEAEQLSRETKRPLAEVVLADMGVSEEQLAEAFAAYYRIPYVRLAAVTVDPEAVKLFNQDQARKLGCVPIKKEEAPGTSQGVNRRPTLVVAMSNPSDLAAVQQIEFATGYKVKTVVATRTEVDDALAHQYMPESWLDDFLRNVEESPDFEIFNIEEDESSPSELAHAAKQSPAVKMANLLIQNAIREGASDIHIEPALNHVQVRNRIHGLLREYMQMPKWIQEPLVSRIKILAKLDISERRVPQDGRIKVSFEKRDIGLRVSTLPTHFGEKVVMRLLGSGQAVPLPPTLGLRETDLETLRRAASQPQGMILVTGPTGSGKTTTLYSLLEEKKHPDINIITVEDPIEFQLSGINQVQVNARAGLTFAASLRSILRQDPDVILVGEIRDLETAEIAFHAAMTGHLVFSTLHTNSTTATVGRLLDLGIEPALITGSVNLVVAQRLLRKLCERCKQPATPDPKILQRLQLQEQQIQYLGPKGCHACQNSGYSGRIGVYELLKISPQLKELIAKKASELDLQESAMANGTVPLVEGAIELVREGITSVDEVARVIQLQNDAMTRCPNCSMLIESDFTSCPFCTYALRILCQSCEQELKPGWRICPYCSAPVEVTEALGRAPIQALPAAGGASIDASPAPQIAAPAPAPVSVPAPDPAPAVTPGPARAPRILVVDDDDVMRAIIVRALELMSQKPEILQAADGPAALAAAVDGQPDVILLDVMMPGMSGIEVCRRLRSNIQSAFMPVLMLTGNTDEETRTKGFLVGTDDFMGKPISVPELHARVNRLLRRTYGL